MGKVFGVLKNSLLILCFLVGDPVFAQPGACIFKDTLFKIDFGTQARPQEFNLRALRNYQRANNDCPNDGFYSYSTKTSGCFNDDWITLPEDHTSGDAGGRMFFVNASYQSSVYFLAELRGFKPNTTYEFGVWMLNLRKLQGGCTPIPPNIVISLETPDGKRVSAFQTGKIPPTDIASWRKFYAVFTTPPDGISLTLKMDNIIDGGCGNDFAMDDLTFRECYMIEPPVVARTISAPKPAPKAEAKPVTPAKTENVEPKAKPKESIIVAKKDLPHEPKQNQVREVILMKVPIPEVIEKRDNPVIKTITTAPAEMVLELYDNGQVDDDTVSIFHNNVLLVSKARLSEKPIRMKIKVDEANPYHELVMVAENLGSIPPNTSLMVITANGKRYEVFISSSEEKNAKLVINLKE